MDTLEAARPPIAGAASTDPQQPLRGVRVAEFCSTAAGPFCAMLLADMGAEVIKVEPPEGDGLRQWPPLSDGYSENFASLNRNKKSVVLDLKDPESRSDRQAHRARLPTWWSRTTGPASWTASVSAMRRWPRTSPRWCICSISAYGQSGPRAAEGGFDLTIQAASGVMSVTGEDGGAPVKCGVPIADFASGLYAAYAIASALLAVRAGAPGAHIDVPMFGCHAGHRRVADERTVRLGTQPAPPRLGPSAQRAVPGVPGGRRLLRHRCRQSATVDEGRQGGGASRTRGRPALRDDERACGQPGGAQGAARDAAFARRAPRTGSRSSPRPACRMRRSTTTSPHSPIRRSRTWAGCSRCSCPTA